MSKVYQLPTNGSFVQVLSCVMFDTSLSMGARLTFAALVEHYNPKNGECRPSQERLATMVGCKARTIRNYLKELIKAGLVTVVKRGCWSRANEYRLNALVNPTAAPESQPVAQPSMRNQGGGDTRNRTSHQQYNNNNNINNWKRRTKEAGAVGFIQRELARRTAKA